MLKRILSSGLFKGIAIYGMADIVQKAISFITIPLFSYYILPEELGIVANFDLVQQIIILLAGQVIINGLTYFFYERTKEENAVLIANLLFIVVTLNILGAIVILLCNNIIEEYLSITLSLQILTIVGACSNMLSSLDSIVYRLENNPKMFVILSLSTSVCQVLLLIYLIIGCHMGGIGKIYGQTLTVSLFCLLHLFLLYKRGYIALRFSIHDVKKLLGFGIPLLPHSLSFWIKGGLDKALITTFCGLAINGLYSMAMSFAGIYALFQNSFSYAYSPYLQKRLSNLINADEANQHNEKIAIVRLSYIVILGFVVIGIFATLVSWIMINFMLDTKYLDSFQFVPWMFMSSTLYSVYCLTIEFAYTSKKTVGIGVITFTGSLIQAILCYILLKNIGINGVKYSMVIGSFIIMIGIWCYSNVVYPMPWLSFFKSK